MDSVEVSLPYENLCSKTKAAIISGRYHDVHEVIVSDPDLVPIVRERKLKIYYHEKLVLTLAGAKYTIISESLQKKAGYPLLPDPLDSPKEYFLKVKEIVG